MATTRLSRDESKARTRADLIAAARRVFLARGFHAATLEEIAEAAGFSKGAVYSNFAGKDDLFLALLEAHYAQRGDAYRALLEQGEESIEVAFRVIARLVFDSYVREPGWFRLLSEFSTHASRTPTTHERLLAAASGFLDLLAAMIDALAERHGVAYSLPTREVARGSGALMRGMAVEWLLDPESQRAGVFEDMHAAYMRGLIVPAHERSTR
jgi:AcrR family transcriptional regulator